MPTLRIKASISVNKRKDTSGVESRETISLMAVQDDPENSKWAKGLPEMNLDATISNPEAFGILDGVREVYVDISPVPLKVATPTPKVAPKVAAKPTKLAKPPPKKVAPKKSKPKTTKKGKRK